jgi:hypothetical protein
MYWKGYGRNGCGLIDLRYWHLPGGIDENHKKSWTG